MVLAGVVNLVSRPVGLADVDEVAADLEGNARLKAVAVCAAVGAPALSDDTGLEVDALGGAPGVLSARYAGENATHADNVAKLLSELEHAGAVTQEQRCAEFKTVAMVVWPDGRELSAKGSVRGWITDRPRGTGGFGYDCVFIPRGQQVRTFAEMGNDKHKISHRGRALRALIAGLKSMVGDGGHYINRIC